MNENPQRPQTRRNKSKAEPLIHTDKKQDASQSVFICVHLWLRMKRIVATLVMSLLVVHAALGEYKRILKISEGSERILSHGESIIYPTFKVKDQKLTRTLEHLSEGTSKYSEDGVGLSIIPIFNPSTYNPYISIDTEGKNFFELLDMICLKAGKEWYWSLEGAVVLYPKSDINSKPIDPLKTQSSQTEAVSSNLSEDTEKLRDALNREIQHTVIPTITFSDMTVPEAILHIQEAYEKETGKHIPIFLSPKAANRSSKVNLSLRRCSLVRILQYICSGSTANLSFSVRGNAIYICVPFEDFTIQEVKIEPAIDGND